MILELLLDALLDSVKMLPFLFAAYWLIEYVEHRHGERIEAVLESSGRWGAIPAALLAFWLVQRIHDGFRIDNGVV